MGIFKSPCPFRYGDSHMEMGERIFGHALKSPPSFGQEIEIFPLSRDCDITLMVLRVPIIRSIALVTIIALFSFGDCLNPCTHPHMERVNPNFHIGSPRLPVSIW